MKGKVALFTGSTFSMPALQALIQLDRLACVVIVESQGSPDTLQLIALLEQNNVPTVQFSPTDTTSVISALDTYQAGIGIVHLFRHKLNEKIIHYFAGDIYNIHPSDLPNYKGPHPLYWQIRHGKDQCVLSVHQLTKHIDAGAIALQQKIDIHPFDTLQSLSHQVSQVVPSIIHTLLDQLDNNAVELVEQTKIENCPTAPRFTEKDLLINWREHTSKDIVCMARAGNVDFGGARIQIDNCTYQLLQATQIKGDYIGVQPGTVLEVGFNAGLIIKSGDGAVRLDVIATPYGVFDGYKFAALFNLDAGLNLHQSKERTF